MAIPLISRSDEIPAILSELQKKKEPINIRLPNTPGVYQSHVVEFKNTSNEAWLLIEHLESAQGNTLLLEQGTFHIEFKLDETYSFTSQLISKELRDGKTLLKIKYPEKRKFYRICADTTICVDLILDSGITCTGVIKDISPEGLGIIMKNQTIPTEDFYTIQSVAFTLPDGTFVSTRVCLRYARLVHETDGDYLNCGMSFIDLDNKIFEHMIIYVLDKKMENEKL